MDIARVLTISLIDVVGGTNGCKVMWDYDEKIYQKCLEYVKNDLIVFTNLLEKKGLSIFYAEGLFCEYLISEIVLKQKEDREKNQQNKMEMLARKLNQQIDNVGKNKISIYDIDVMTGEDFEKYMYNVFFKLGFVVELTKSTGDQGVDLLITNKNGVVIAVQCKRYNETVGNGAIQEVIAGSNYYNTTGCLVVTNNYFTKSAQELAEKSKVILWNRDYLIDIISNM